MSSEQAINPGGNPLEIELVDLPNPWDWYKFDWEFLHTVWLGIRNIQKNYPIGGVNYSALNDALCVIELEMLGQQVPSEQVRFLRK